MTDLSHSRAIIELEGQMVKEVIKKGCPINIEDLKKKPNFKLNLSQYNGHDRYYWYKTLQIEIDST